MVRAENSYASPSHRKGFSSEKEWLPLVQGQRTPAAFEREQVTNRWHWLEETRSNSGSWE